MSGRAEKQIAVFVAEVLIILCYRNSVGTRFLVREANIEADAVALLEDGFDKV